MKAKFISLSKSNQSIKLFVDILDKSQKNNYQSFKYNNKELFKYSFNIINSQQIFQFYHPQLIKRNFIKKL